jgi:hypothetical protein
VNSSGAHLNEALVVRILFQRRRIVLSKNCMALGKDSDRYLAASAAHRRDDKQIVAAFNRTERASMTMLELVISRAKTKLAGKCG